VNLGLFLDTSSLWDAPSQQGTCSRNKKQSYTLIHGWKSYPPAAPHMKYGPQHCDKSYQGTNAHFQPQNILDKLLVSESAVKCPGKIM